MEGSRDVAGLQLEVQTSAGGVPHGVQVEQPHTSGSTLSRYSRATAPSGMVDARSITRSCSSDGDRPRPYTDSRVTRGRRPGKGRGAVAGVGVEHHDPLGLVRVVGEGERVRRPGVPRASETWANVW